MAAEIKTEYPEKEVSRQPGLGPLGGWLPSVLLKENQEFVQGLGGGAPLTHSGSLLPISCSAQRGPLKSFSDGNFSGQQYVS